MPSLNAPLTAGTASSRVDCAAIRPCRGLVARQGDDWFGLLKLPNQHEMGSEDSVLARTLQPTSC